MLLHSLIVADRDRSNGYQEVAADFLAARGRRPGGIGARTVEEWARALPAGAAVLDLGCGNGVPVTELLLALGLQVYGVDAAPAMVESFQSRLAGVPVQCASVEESDFFGRTFDAVVAWGLVFLLAEDTQRRLLAKIAGALRDGGFLLFTAPRQRCTWADAMTRRNSVSLGQAEYRSILESAGMLVEGTRVDEGENHYYLARKV